MRDPWKNKYFQAFVIAFYVGAVSALGVYFASVTQDLGWRQMVAIIGSAFLFPFAALAKALPDPLHVNPAPVVNMEHVENAPVTTDPAPPADEPPAPTSAPAPPCPPSATAACAPITPSPPPVTVTAKGATARRTK